MKPSAEALVASQTSERTLPQTARLLDIMQALRDPQTGCPWDLNQTMETLIPYTIEETYEVADAITRGGREEIKDELGDLLFQVVFYAQLAREQGDFSFDEVAGAIADKLVRRHPHVFGDGQADTPEAVLRQWEQIKQQERANKPDDHSVFSGVPVNLPALMQAQKIQKRCANVGFDWPDAEPVLAKIREEVAEVEDALSQTSVNAEAVEEEVGDLLFAVVNLARHCQVNPETALRKANQKFMRRFRAVEQTAQQQGVGVEALDLNALEVLWQSVKRTEKT
ncbi:nucleoside triphosphate pyrophosphohydrolase [Aliidiomarina sanyensis]|uniref:Nucleoside triphosphate pyrophosphohydrolase n=1 Tax=Aliidiomarina sanyensis TaxID=1249555 RepID=A0A432WRF3_9GAMM|nr:nucleoside triphosphate pyrophosphohydrolase [Aliidiomarina sanyensis]RUO36350.1 nucleoside triphosphate pyrophosphohydrolase [Aliidiomarina sanyensis]